MPGSKSRVDSVYFLVDTGNMGRDFLSTSERLVLVTLELLEEEGLEGLSQRRVARRAGVSHAAPLRHFPSFAALLSEVASRGFRGLEEAVGKAAAQLPPGSHPLARLAAGARAYVDEAVAKPGLFALMFRPELLQSDHPGLQRDGSAAFEQLVGHVRAAQDAGFHADRDTRVLAGALWSLVHGIATLSSQGALEPPTGASLETVLETALSLAVSTTAPKGEDA